MSLALALGAALAAVLALAGVAGWSHHAGYVSGQDDEIAHYAPLIASADAARDTANARADRAERVALKINSDSEKDHVLMQQTLADRAATADARIAGSLHERAAAERAARSCQLSAVAGSASASAGTPASDERDNRFAASLSGVGGRCEHDASEVAGYQRWYAEQRANAAAQ